MDFKLNDLAADFDGLPSFTDLNPKSTTTNPPTSSPTESTTTSTEVITTTLKAIARASDKLKDEETTKAPVAEHTTLRSELVSIRNVLQARMKLSENRGNQTVKKSEKQEEADDDDEEDEDDDGGGGLLGAIISGFLGSLSRVK